MNQAEPCFTRKGFNRGVRKMLPIALFVVLFGMAFGVAATEQGMEGWVAVAMSASSFAGASQFATLDLWQEKVPLLPLIIITFAVNARHLLMGAAFSHWMRPLGWPKVLLTASVMTDPNFALVTAARREGERDVAMLLGAGLTLWTTWSLGTLIGVGLGNSIGDPAAMGIDVLLPSFFTALLIGMWRGRGTLAPWLAAAGVAILVSQLLPGHWHIMIGALAGGLVGAFTRGVEVDLPTALAVMALTTYATRIGGVVIMRWIPLSRRVERFLEALSGSVLVALVAPVALAGDLGIKLALAVAAATMLATRNAVAAIAASMLAVVLVRAII